MEVGRSQLLFQQGKGDLPSFLRGKATDESDKGTSRFDSQPAGLLQGGFAGRFALLPRVGVVGLRQMSVGRRIPAISVDAVHDAGQDVGSVAQHIREPAPERLALDLLGIGRTDGAESVGEDDARLQQVQVPVELHLSPVEVLPVDAGQQHVPVPEAALVGQVVDRKERGCLGEGTVVAVEQFAVSGDQAGLPIVAMEQIDGAVHLHESFHDGSAEEDETLAVVLIVPAVLAVKLRAVVVIGLVDEPDGDLAVGKPAPEESAADVFGGDGDVQLVVGNIGGGARLESLPVGGEEELDVVAEAFHFARQGAHHIGEPPRLGERDGFAGCEDDVHVTVSPVEGWLLPSTGRLPPSWQRGETPRVVFIVFDGPLLGG